MFGRFFGATYYGETYWGPGVVVDPTTQVADVFHVMRGADDVHLEGQLLTHSLRGADDVHLEGQPTHELTGSDAMTLEGH